MVELEELVKLKEWTDLLHVLSQEQKASFRQILAAHLRLLLTTTPTTDDPKLEECRAG